MTLWELYLIFCKIGVSTFGGGYAMLPLFQTELVANYHLLAPAEFLNMAALAQLTPGAIGLNIATFIGFKHSGITGALTATAGLLTPPLFIVTFIACFFLHFADNPWVKAVSRGIRPVMLGLIAASGLFFLENSVFTAPIPWQSWLGTASAASVRPAENVSRFGLNWGNAVIFLIALLAGSVRRVPVLVVLLGCAGLGLLRYWLCPGK